MPIEFRCEQCDQRMSISRRMAGGETVCPRCGKTTRIPPLEEAEEDGARDAAPVADVPNRAAAASTVIATGSGGRTTHFAAGDANADPSVPPLRPRLAAVEQERESAEPEFELQRRGADAEEMDLTPMVDVTFLLLIFFMVTASFSIQKSLEVPPPNPETEGAAQTVQPLEELEEKSILIEIDEDNQMRVEDEPVADPRDLPLLLAQIRSRDRKNEVLVTATEQTDHEAVVTAIDAAQDVGMQRIRWAIRGAN